jgi:hypothetical protein
MNRRSQTAQGYTIFSNADGPVDHDVPVLLVTAPDGKKMRAILFGYACHNTTLDFYQFCGDYAGFAQEYIEETHPGTVALFMIGCGADQNPTPRRTLEWAKQHGRAVANGVEQGWRRSLARCADRWRSGQATLEPSAPPSVESSSGDFHQQVSEPARPELLKDLRQGGPAHVPISCKWPGSGMT